jgi:hypothetical protein
VAGYSKRALVDKLGIKPRTRIAILNDPPAYWQTLGQLPEQVVVLNRIAGEVDFVQFFATERAELQKRFPHLKRAMAQDGMLWISWPKKASKIMTDLNENVVREIGLQNGLVDIKVCAVDDIWSGLKFVYRVRDRKRDH